MGDILDITKPTEQVAVLDEPKPRKRSECRCCGCERKGSGQWLDHEYCSGKCSKLDGESVATTELKNCKCCGVERNPNIIWHSRDYCSGKCKKLDGETIEPADESVDEIGAGDVATKEEQIRAVESQLATYQKEFNTANEEADSAMERRSDTLAQGGDDPYGDYQVAVDRRDKLGSTVSFVEEITLPKLFKELQALQRSGKNIAVRELMKRRDEIVEQMQTHMREIDVLLAGFNCACKEMKYGYPKGKTSPIKALWFTEELRKALRLRTRQRIAKQVIHEL